MIDDDRLIEGILVIMRACWNLPSDLEEGELEGFAAELLKRIQAGDSKLALDGYLSLVQANKLRIPPPNAWSEIVDRATILIRNSQPPR
jgi:hypothetical protein